MQSEANFTGSGSQLFGIKLANFFLNVFTLGVYSSWAKVRVRKYIWNNTYFANKSFSYTGTGKEIFLGYIKIVALYILYSIIFAFFQKVIPDVFAVLKILFGLTLFFVSPYVIYFARAYQLSRTQWNEISFGLERSAADQYAILFYKNVLLSMITLGIYSPIANNQLHAFLVNHTRYGSKYFSYDGDDKAAFKIGLKGIFLSILTLGVYYFWYKAEIARFRVSHTTFQELKFEWKIEGTDIFAFFIASTLLGILTLGFATPFVEVKKRELFASLFSAQGNIDLTSVRIRENDGSAAGDEWLGELDLGLSL